jgi:hypothetical protein
MEFPQEAKKCDIVITLVGIYLRECSPEDRTTCTRMFIAALFTIFKLWKQINAIQAMNDFKKCGTYTQCNIKNEMIMFYVHALRGLEEQISHVFPHMWKLVLKSMPIYYNIHTET